MELYKLSEQYQELQSLLEDGELPEEAIADTLEGLEGELKEKSDNISCLIKNLEAESEMIKNEAKRQLARAYLKLKRAQKLREYLKNQLIKCNIFRIETPRNKIQIKRNPSKLEISEEFTGWAAENADNLLKYAPPTPDKTAIKEELREGKIIPFVELKNDQRIDIT